MDTKRLPGGHPGGHPGGPSGGHPGVILGALEQ